MRKKIKILFFTTFVFVSFIFCQNPAVNSSKEIFAGIEIGAKGVKVTILKIKNIKKAEYDVIDSWADNITVAKGISTNGIIFPDDITNAATIASNDYQRLISTKYSVDKKNIFVVISSGVAKAKNTNDLAAAIEKLISIKPKIVTIEEESKLLIKGGVPPKKLDDAIMIDIGGGNTKGGFVVKVQGSDSYIFVPFGFDFGTVTLTEKNKKYAKDGSFDDYLRVNASNTDSLSKIIKTVFNKNPLFQNKKNIYISGGSVWAFLVLSKLKTADTYSPFTSSQVKDYYLNLLTNYKQYEDYATTNDEAKNVLNTYSQLYLISGNSILLEILKNINEVETKNFFFINQGHLNWLKGFILESAKGQIPIY